MRAGRVGARVGRCRLLQVQRLDQRERGRLQLVVGARPLRRRVQPAGRQMLQQADAGSDADIAQTDVLWWKDTGSALVQ